MTRLYYKRNDKMNNLETACLLSCERWADTFEKEIPEHIFSKEHNEKMKSLLSDNLIKYKPKLSKKTLKFILIAAIILSLAITVFATAKPAFEKYSLKMLSDHSIYNVILDDKSYAKKVNSLNVKYIPNGFEKTEEENNTNNIVYTYKNNDKYFYVGKYTLDTSVGYNTERYEDELIKINNKEYIYYKVDDNMQGILFNNGEYIYEIDGNISKEELVDVAQNIE